MGYVYGCMFQQKAYILVTRLRQLPPDSLFWELTFPTQDADISAQQNSKSVQVDDCTKTAANLQTLKLA